MSVVVLDYERIPSNVTIWLPTDDEKRHIAAVDPNKRWPYWVRMEDGTLDAGEDAAGLHKLLGAVESQKNRKASEEQQRILSERQRSRIVGQIGKIADLLNSLHEIRIQVNEDSETFSIHQPSGEMLLGPIDTLQELCRILVKLPEDRSGPSFL